MKKLHLLASVTAMLAVLTLAGCNSQEAEPQMQMPPLPIDVAQVAFQEVQSWHTYTTRLESPQRVILMPRVSGVVESIAFTEGQTVQQGDALFQIDPRPFQAVVDRLRAQILAGEAALEEAINREKRALNLGKSSAISIEQVESRSADSKQRKAELLALKAQLDSALLDLEFTSVKSPITGVISRAEITEGNNVIANQSVLTNIVSNDEMYAYFDIDERTWNSDFANVTSNTPLPVMLTLAGSSKRQYQGHIDFVDNAVNASTGTIRVRATFDNHTQERALKAGSFARLKLASTDIEKHILVPDRAIGTDLKNRFVLTIGEDNTVQYRQVTAGERYGQYRVITEGLNPEDNIAVNGPAKVFPGMVISPRNVTLDLSAVALTVDPAAAETFAAVR
ncbi:efflux RND transporter periplasmic adaptor subunit [Thalassotalea euphylliae]|uniref:Efflux RND transporter periplasmic adaptor subunit n=1 Tax=Thalassotalea euphylliae TaxID=1655234 RepID=A0A3E0UE57_9GAMM|nr:efflux RND transporter periplasmic adaptor subunit [Thalassotalea euphylliae]REL34984.1 efflux RND transporter periplasmic adaptor subunit [Thalassotalea euphylliae]